MKKVVGLAGRAESGKTTAAKMLHSMVMSQNGYNLEFSEPIVNLAQSWINCMPKRVDAEQALGYLAGTARELQKDGFDGLLNAGQASPLLRTYFETRSSYIINSETKSQHRMLLEWLGRGVVDFVSPSYWADILENKARDLLSEGADFVTLCGVRSEYDARAARNIGGCIIRITRTMPSQLLPSESGINAWKEDFCIENNGTIIDLRNSIATVWQYLQVDKSNIDQAI